MGPYGSLPFSGGPTAAAHLPQSHRPGFRGPGAHWTTSTRHPPPVERPSRGHAASSPGREGVLAPAWTGWRPHTRYRIAVSPPLPPAMLGQVSTVPSRLKTLWFYLSPRLWSAAGIASPGSAQILERTVASLLPSLRGKGLIKKNSYEGLQDGWFRVLPCAQGASASPDPSHYGSCCPCDPARVGPLSTAAPPCLCPHGPLLEQPLPLSSSTRGRKGGRGLQWAANEPLWEWGGITNGPGNVAVSADLALRPFSLPLGDFTDT